MTGPLFDICFASYLLSGIIFLVYSAFPKALLSRIGYLLQAIGLISGATLFTIVWRESGYPPLRNLHESMTLMAHCIVLWNITQSLVHPLRLLLPVSGLSAGLLMAWASASGGVQEHTLPALQSSFWLTSHVFLSMLSYAAIALGALASLFRLMAYSGAHRVAATGVLSLLACGGGAAAVVKILLSYGVLSFSSPSEKGGIIIASAFIAGSLALPMMMVLFARFGVFAAMERDVRLAGFVRTAAIIGLAMISLAIMTGSVWGDVAWGRYWGWDPKEVWAFISWLSLLAFVHARYLVRDSRDWTPWIIVIGLLTVLFNYFGVNFVLAGLHSYAG